MTEMKNSDESRLPEPSIWESVEDQPSFNDSGKMNGAGLEITSTNKKSCL